MFCQPRSVLLLLQNKHTSSKFLERSSKHFPHQAIQFPHEPLQIPARTLQFPTRNPQHPAQTPEFPHELPNSRTLCFMFFKYMSHWFQVLVILVCWFSFEYNKMFLLRFHENEIQWTHINLMIFIRKHDFSFKETKNSVWHWTY